MAGIETNKVIVITSNYTIKEGGTYIISMDTDESDIIITFSFPQNLTTKVELIGNDSIRTVLQDLHPANGMMVFDIDDNIWKTKINGFYCFNGVLSVMNGIPELLTGIGKC